MNQISENVFLFEDTCNVYIIRTGDKAILIDFGDGEVMKHLSSIGVNGVTDVLFTHHHRDQVQGLNKTTDNIRIWVPHTEQDLFHSVDKHWQARELDNNYNMRQDRFSILQPVPVFRTLKDYSTHVLNGITFTIIPTPGHTVGSITIMAEIDKRNVAFSGDLIYASGKMWSLAATQWSYNGGEGIALSILSMLNLKDRGIDVLLPSHGNAMDQPREAMELLIERLSSLMKERKQNPRLFELREKPYENITPHLLKNRTIMANSYVLLSESGKALLIDYGYDFIGGIAAGFDRASRRPWLYTMSKLKTDFNISKIDVVIPTHFHDDHVAGFNLLRDVEGTQVWCPENFSDILVNPKTYNLPCLWYDPIPVDKKLPLNQKIKWEEYEFTLYEQPGHTLYAVAIDFVVDGKRVLAIGDQYQGDGDEYNYVYHNKFGIHDYVDSASLYKRIDPDILISGHWDPVYVTEDYLKKIEEKGGKLEQLHKAILPLDEFDFGVEDFSATIRPYQSFIPAGDPFTISIEVTNPFKDDKMIEAELIAPSDWKVSEKTFSANVLGKKSMSFTTTITIPNNAAGYRERIAVDVTVGNQRFGQHAEALVTIL